MESPPPRHPPERRYPLRSNRAPSRAPPRHLPPGSSSSSSSAPNPRPLAFAPPPTSPPASNHHRASSSAALDAATGEAVDPISSEGTTVSSSAIPFMAKNKHRKEKEVKETPEARSQAERTCTSRARKDTVQEAKNKQGQEKGVKETTEPTSSMSRVARIGSNHLTVQDRKNFIIIDTEELSHALDTHGVSYAEKTNIFDNLVNKCNEILKETVNNERGRCNVLIKKISELIDKYFPLCHVLGEPDKATHIQMTATLKHIESFLISAVAELEEMKIQRLKKLQEMQGNLIDLWDRLGITIAKQRPYSFMMRHCTALLDEVVEMNALSPEFLQKVEQEVERLKMLLKEAVTEKLAVLNRNLHKGHIFGDKNYEVDFTIADIDAGNLSIFLAYDCVEELIAKSSRELAEREDILAQAERVLNARSGGKTLKYQGRDDVCNFREKVEAWEAQHGREFLYDGDLLIGKLERVARDDQERRGTSSTGCGAAASAETSSDSEKSASDNSYGDPDFIPSESEDEV